VFSPSEALGTTNTPEMDKKRGGKRWLKTVKQLQKEQTQGRKRVGGNKKLVPGVDIGSSATMVVGNEQNERACARSEV